MEQGPVWDADRFSASQEIPLILWNPKFHYPVHKCPPPVPFLSQIDPVHVSTFNALKIELNINFLSKSRSSQRSLSLSFPYLDPVHT